MADYDGSVRIGVKMELDNAEKQVGQLKKSFESQTKAIERQALAVQRLKEQYDRLLSAKPLPEGAERLAEQFAAARTEAAKLDRELQAAKAAEQAGGAAPESAARIQELTQKVTEADARADGLRQRLLDMYVAPGTVDKMDRLAGAIGAAEARLGGLQQEAGGTSSQLSQAEASAADAAARLQEIANNAVVADQGIVTLQRELEQLKVRQADLEAAGVGLGYEEYDKNIARIQDIKAALAEYEKGLQGAGSEETAAAGRLERLRAAMGHLKDALGRMASAFIGSGKRSSAAVGGLRKNISKLGKEKGLDRAGEAASRLLGRIKRLVISAFFFRVIARNLRALVAGIGRYLTANRTFANALSGLKSNFLTAFQPIYDHVMPALTALMEGLENVTAKLAVFMATIFGTTADQAQKGAESLYEQANATEEAGKAADQASKKQKELLASFDTIEKLGAKEEEETNKTKPEFDTDFSQVEAPQWLLDFWKVFQDGWGLYGAPTMETFRNAVQAIKDLIASIGKVFLGIWTGGTGLELLGRIHQLLQTIFGMVADIAAAFRTAWNGGGGEAVLSALSYMLTALLDLIIRIGVSFREAWNDGHGVTICQLLLSIFQNLFTIVGNLANRLREAWDANANGVRIWEAVLGIAEIILGTIDRIAEATVRWSETLNLEPLVSGVRTLLESLLPLLALIGDALAVIWETQTLPFLTWLLETALPGLLGALSSVFDFLSRHPALIQFLTGLVVDFVAAWKLGDAIHSIADLVSQLDFARIAMAAIVGLILMMVQNFSKMNGIERFAAVFGTIALAVGALCVVIAYLTGSLLGVAGAIAAITIGVASVSGAIGSVMSRSVGSSIGGGSGGRSYAARSTPTAYSASALMDRYPHLAGGAVIAPNHEFLAVLGDQRSGTNIETPLATMKQAFLEALSESSVQGGGGSGTAVLDIDGRTFARLTYPYIQGERSRLGVNLVAGGAF